MKWTSEVMNKIMEETDKELQRSVKQVFVHQAAPQPAHEYECKCHNHPPVQHSKINLATVREADEEIIDEGGSYKSITSIEHKISTASCHKRRRGYARKLIQQTNIAQEAQDRRGIERCTMLDENKAQNDTGATHSITNNKNALVKFRKIPPLPISGISADGTAIYATGKGYLPVQSDEGDTILIECLYSAQAAGTLLSPTAITVQYKDIYLGWSMHANTNNNTGYMQLIHADGINHATFSMFCENRMWFHYLKIGEAPQQPTIRKLSSLSEYELWHHRLGHCNDTVLQKMHNYARGIPKLKVPDFYKCQSCAYSKIRKDSSTKTKSSLRKELGPEEKIHPGQHLHMDFGFVRGSAFSKRDELGRTITSIDGFLSYLIVVDRATRFKWTFLTTTKHPPIDEIESVL